MEIGNESERFKKSFDLKKGRKPKIKVKKKVSQKRI
jgi:hypothetical protein